MEALRGCPPSARPPRPASAARQPNVNLGATRARTRPATRRAPLRPVWRHGRRWRGERRPSWCYRFAARAQSNMQIARTKPTSVPGSARRGASPGSARRDLSAGTVGLSLPSCTSALARAPPSTSPRPPAGARAARGPLTTTHRSYHTTRTTKRGRAALPPGCRISAARKPSPRSLVSTRGSPSRGRRRCPSSKMRKGASRRSRVKPR